MGIPWADRPWTPLPWTHFPPTIHPSANHPATIHASANLDRMDIDVPVANNPGFAGRHMARGPTLPSSSRASAPRLAPTRGMPSTASTPSASQVPRPLVAHRRVVVPQATNFATAPTNQVATFSTRTLPLPPVKRSEAARLRLREQREAASASRKDEDTTRARARQARAAERA